MKNSGLPRGVFKPHPAMEEMSFWSIVAWCACCMQKFNTPFSVVLGIQSSNFAQRWAVGWWNAFSGLALQVGHTLPHNSMVTRMWEISFCLFCKGAIFLSFLEFSWLQRFVKFDRSIFFLLHYMVHATQNMESLSRKNNMLDVLPVAGGSATVWNPSCHY